MAGAKVYSRIYIMQRRTLRKQPLELLYKYQLLLHRLQQQHP
jgi:hypothetical protein